MVQKKQLNKFNGIFTKKRNGEIFGHIDEDEAGRSTVACITLLPRAKPFEKLLGIHS